MAADLLDYPALVEEALLDVVREVLRRAADEGLPGEHHVFLTFGTREEGVEIPPFLAERYPEEMTIVLQHQYWDLEVEEARFAVTLSFDRRRHRLSVPFAAVSAFADPSVGFGLRFGDREEEAEGPGGEEEAGAETPVETGKPGKVISTDRFGKKS